MYTSEGGVGGREHVPHGMLANQTLVNTVIATRDSRLPPQLSNPVAP